MTTNTLGQVLYEAFRGERRWFHEWKDIARSTQADFECEAQAVAAVVREQCAQVCEQTYTEMDDVPRPCFDTAAECAQAIRSMKP